MLLLELRILSMENARGFEVRGEGWGPRGRVGSMGSGMLRKGRNRKGLVMGRVGGGEAMVEPEEEWKEVESGERGELTEDSGESHTLIRGEEARPGSTASCSILTVLGTRLCCLDTNMALCGGGVSACTVLTRLEDVTLSAQLSCTPPCLNPQLRHQLASHWSRRRPMGGGPWRVIDVSAAADTG